jgi:hypothetical protein
MKLSDYKQDYYTFSKELSKLVRILAFAGIGIIWIFKFEKNGVPQIPKTLFKPLLFLIITILFDFFHYFSATIIWGIFHRRQEMKMTDTDTDPELEANPLFNWPVLFFFYLKQLLLIVAYCFLFVYIYSKW